MSGYHSASDFAASESDSEGPIPTHLQSVSQSRSRSMSVSDPDPDLDPEHQSETEAESDKVLVAADLHKVKDKDKDKDKDSHHRHSSTENHAESFLHSVQLANVNASHKATSGHGPSDLPRLSGFAPLGRRITLRTVPFGDPALKSPIAPMQQVPAITTNPLSPSTGSHDPNTMMDLTRRVSSAFLLTDAEKQSSSAAAAAAAAKTRKRWRMCLLLTTLSVFVFLLVSALVTFSTVRILASDWTVAGNLQIDETVSARRLKVQSALSIANRIQVDEQGIAIAGHRALSFDPLAISFDVDIVASKDLVLTSSNSSASSPSSTSASSASSSLLRPAGVHRRDSANANANSNSNAFVIRSSKRGSGVLLDNRDNEVNPDVHLVPGPTGSRVYVHGPLCFVPHGAIGSDTSQLGDYGLQQINTSAYACLNSSSVSNFFANGSASSTTTIIYQTIGGNTTLDDSMFDAIVANVTEHVMSNLRLLNLSIVNQTVVTVVNQSVVTVVNNYYNGNGSSPLLPVDLDTVIANLTAYINSLDFSQYIGSSNATASCNASCTGSIDYDWLLANLSSTLWSHVTNGSFALCNISSCSANDSSSSWVDPDPSDNIQYVCTCNETAPYVPSNEWAFPLFNATAGVLNISTSSDAGGDIQITPASGTLILDVQQVTSPRQLVLSSLQGVALSTDVWIRENLHVSNASSSVYIQASHAFITQFGDSVSSPFLSLGAAQSILRSTDQFSVWADVLDMGMLQIHRNASIVSHDSVTPVVISNPFSTLRLELDGSTTLVSQKLLLRQTQTGGATLGLDPVLATIASSEPEVHVTTSSPDVSLTIGSSTMLYANDFSLVSDSGSSSFIRFETAISGSQITSDRSQFTMCTALGAGSCLSLLPFTTTLSILDSAFFLSTTDPSHQVRIAPNAGLLEASHGLRIASNSSMDPIAIDPVSGTLITSATLFSFTTATANSIVRIAVPLGSASLSIEPGSGTLYLQALLIDLVPPSSSPLPSPIVLRSNQALTIRSGNTSTLSVLTLEASEVSMATMRLVSTTGDVTLDASSTGAVRLAPSTHLFSAAPVSGSFVFQVSGASAQFSSSLDLALQSTSSNISLQSPGAVLINAPYLMGSTALFDTLRSRTVLADLRIATSTASNNIILDSNRVYVSSRLFLTASTVSSTTPTIASPSDPLYLNATHVSVFTTSGALDVRTPSSSSTLRLDAASSTISTSSSTLALISSAALLLSYSPSSARTTIAAPALSFSVTSPNSVFSFSGGLNTLMLGTLNITSSSLSQISTSDSVLYLSSTDHIQPTSVLRLDNSGVAKPLRWEDANGPTIWAPAIDPDLDFSFFLWRADTSTWDARVAVGQDGIIWTRGGWAIWSSVHIKHDIHDISAEHALDTVAKMQGVTYRLTDTDEQHVGFIAEELELAAPWAVSRKKKLPSSSTNENRFANVAATATASEKKKMEEKKLEEEELEEEEELLFAQRMKAQRDMRTAEKNDYAEVMKSRDLPAVNIPELVPLLTEAIKALKSRVEALEARIQHLEHNAAPASTACSVL
eukprot:ANDGO_00709.mRNA.1 hypothetical protein